MNLVLNKLLNNFLILFAILLCLPAAAGETERDSVTVSLITCWPGTEIYELCGHSAIRIRSEKTDSIWNYGLFDFNAPNFVYRYVKGETDYMVGGYPFAWFMPEYVNFGRKVLEQDLNLTNEEALKLRKILQTESLPQNREYRYNYVLDNCATRITQRISDAIGAKIDFPDSLDYGTFRNEMRHFHKDYPWYQFGIDLALGSGIDRPIHPDEEMFVPMVMAQRYSSATLPDGRPLVKAERVLYEGVGNASLPPTPWFVTPLFLAWAAFLIVAILCLIMLRKVRLFRIVYSVWFLLIGLTGIVITFLVFISVHEATDPNILIFWLNPLQLVIGAGIWWKSWRWPVAGIAWLNIILLTILLIVWPFQNQSANPAFFPLMGITLILAATYAILAPKISYNIDKRKSKNEQVSNLGNSGTRKSRSNVGKRRRPDSTSRGRNSR